MRPDLDGDALVGQVAQSINTDDAPFCSARCGNKSRAPRVKEEKGRAHEGMAAHVGENRHTGERVIIGGAAGKEHRLRVLPVWHNVLRFRG